MAARKLQTEIDRTLKKVAEGVELFESIYDKMQASTNQTQKEKLETDLKTQIKKLQRLRDQIKTWVASNDIKDKTQLLDNRRLIETQMEKFKACEKEMKTKAFSKEGLIASAKLDPKAQEKLETRNWLQTQVEELQLQIETAEAEIETLQGGGKKKSRSGGAQAERLEALERLNERRKWHINRLELILRLLDNGSLSVERVNDLKDDVSYFVESNTEEEFEEDEGIYDELNLDEEEEKFGLAAEGTDSDESEDASEADLPPRTPSKKHHDEESVSSSKRDGSPVLKKAAGVTLQLRKGSIAADSSKPSPSPISILKPNPPPQPQPRATAPLPIKYAAAAAAAVNNPPATAQAGTSQQAVGTPTTTSATTTTTTTPATPAAPSTTTTTATADQTVATISPSLTHPSVTSPPLSSAASVSVAQAGDSSPALSEPVADGRAGASPQRVTSRNAPTPSPAVSHLPAAPTADKQPVQPVSNGFSSQASASASQEQVSQAPGAPSTFSTATVVGTSPMPLAQQAQPQYPPGFKVSEQPPLATAPQQQTMPSIIRPPSPAPSRPILPNLPNSLTDLMVTFDHVKQKAPQRNLAEVQKLLEGSYASMPQPQDTEKPKYYVPRHPFQTPPYYPQEPHHLLNTPAIFSQLDVETLFYIFYFHAGTYQQFLAAKELKRQSWRFHVKYLTWFQRHAEPQAITDEYEQGVYVYFDWEGSWCQRKKSDFRFEYRYLSED